MIVSSQHVNVNGLYVLPPQHSLRVPYPSSSAYGKRSGFCPEIDQFRAVPEKFKQKTYRSTSWLSRLISLSGWSVRYGRQGSCPCQNHPIGCGEECSSWIRPLVNHTQVFYRTRKCDACSFPLGWLKIEIRKCSFPSTFYTYGNWWIVHRWLHPRVLQTCKWKSYHILHRDLDYCSSGIGYERGKQYQPWFKIYKSIKKLKAYLVHWLTITSIL